MNPKCYIFKQFQKFKMLNFNSKMKLDALKCAWILQKRILRGCPLFGVVCSHLPALWKGSLAFKTVVKKPKGNAPIPKDMWKPVSPKPGNIWERRGWVLKEIFISIYGKRSVNTKGLTPPLLSGSVLCPWGRGGVFNLSRTKRRSHSGPNRTKPTERTATVPGVLLAGAPSAVQRDDFLSADVRLADGALLPAGSRLQPLKIGGKTRRSESYQNMVLEETIWSKSEQKIEIFPEAWANTKNYILIEIRWEISWFSDCSSPIFSWLLTASNFSTISSTVRIFRFIPV